MNLLKLKPLAFLQYMMGVLIKRGSCEHDRWGESRRKRSAESRVMCLQDKERQVLAANQSEPSGRAVSLRLRRHPAQPRPVVLDASPSEHRDGELVKSLDLCHFDTVPQQTNTHLSSGFISLFLFHYILLPPGFQFKLAASGPLHRDINHVFTACRF